MFVPSDEGERGISYRGVSPLLMGYNTYTPAPHEFAERAPATRLARHLEPRARSPPARERPFKMDPRAALGLVLGRHEGGSTDNLAILPKKLASLHSSNSLPPLFRMRWYSFSTPRRPSARLGRSVPRPAAAWAPGALDRPTVVRYASFRNRSRISSYKRCRGNSRA